MATLSDINKLKSAKTKDLPEYVYCYLCGSDNYRVLYPSNLTETDLVEGLIFFRGTNNKYAEHGRIVQCLRCGLIYTNPRDKQKDILDFYENIVDIDYLNTKKERTEDFKRLFKQINHFSKGHFILDIGCYAGFFLKVAQEAGWKAFGIEPSKWARAYANSEGIKVVAATLEKAKFADESFEVVTMWHVLDHLIDPLKTLKEINRILKKGGILALSSHDIESLIARILKNKYPFLVRAHLIYFSKRTLSDMLKKSGFQIILWKKYGRHFSLNYLIKRFQIRHRIIGYLINLMINRFKLDNLKIYINLGEVVQVYAKKI